MNIRMYRIGFAFFAMMFGVGLNAQRLRKLPIPFSKSTCTGLQNVSITLGADTTKDLVVALSGINYFAQSFVSNYVVYKRNGRVVLFHSPHKVFEPDGSDLRKEALGRKRSKEFRLLLYSTFETTRFKLHQDSLNLTTKPGKDGMSTSIHTEDGSFYFLMIWSAKGCSSYNTYAPEAVINSKFPGWTERKKFMDIFTEYSAHMKKDQSRR